MDTHVKNTSVNIWIIQPWNNEFTSDKANDLCNSRFEKSWSWDHLGIILGSSWDHLGMVLGQSVGYVFTLFLLLRDMFGACLGHVWANFWITFGKLFRKQLRSQNRMKLCQITFRLKVKILMRSRGRSRVLLNYVRQPYVHFFYGCALACMLWGNHKVFHESCKSEVPLSMQGGGAQGEQNVSTWSLIDSVAAFTPFL